MDGAVPAALALVDLQKSYAGVRVVKGVNLEVHAGEVHGLMGANGAGKSTLMNLVGGLVHPDGGRMLLEGREYVPASPRDATRAGISFIHQELSLFPNLTVAENLFVSAPPTGPLWSLKRRAMRETAASYLDRFKVKASPNALVGDLPMGVNQTIEIAKSLLADAKILILDEPTTSLSTVEKESLFRIIGELRKQGVAIIYISHILEDALAVCDRIAVLRDGELVATRDRGALSQSELVQLMVGRELESAYPSVDKEIGDVVFEARAMSRAPSVKGVSVTLRKGEIVGMFGLMGAGRTELLRLLFGLDRADTGTLEVLGKPLPHPTPSRAIEAGMAFVTEDRRVEGLIMPKSVSDNLVLVSLPAVRGPFGFAVPAKINALTTWAVSALGIRVRQPRRQTVMTLSGGNQQKVVLGKWLLLKPRIFALDEPTRGVDVGAKYEIYGLINNLAKEGGAVLFVSSEMEELTGLCDRIIVMAHGKITDDVPRADFDQHRILTAALGGDR